MRTIHLLAALAVSLPAAGRAAEPPRPRTDPAGPARTGPRRAAGARPADLKLKPGAEGKVCLDCHTEFQKILARPVPHTPVRSRNCTGCHNPHASHQGRLLAAPAELVCAGCHGDETPASSRSVHEPAAAKKCLSCHDPHASAVRAVLVKPAMDLCASCHKALVDRAGSVKRPHAPIGSAGCAACHEPHASAVSAHLLSKPVPEICAGCHRTDRPDFAKQHMGYPVGKADCTSCHDPHGSDTKGMLYDRVHAPVARGMCAQCHLAPGSSTPFATKSAGAELCRSCHGPFLAKMLDRNRLHLPVVEGKACLECHSPHAAKRAALLSAEPKALCGGCHSDTIQRDVAARDHHAPVRDGKCTSCHDPHSGNAALLLVNADRLELCKACHDWGKHSSHPVGAKAVDPRNPNRTLECLSCHRAHGTEFRKLAPFASTSELCTNCHKQFRR